MAKYNVQVKFSNGVKDNIVINADNIKDAKRQGYNYVQDILKDCKKKLKICSLEISEMAFEYENQV